ncbi:hypothetical protein AUK40_04540 [Candidatus Wirthbacteria bacterium CG2_30_54_11]|uniref:Uncharacterized protein n=1 Tax=Candidatus Wirthbacteria bacterium CG2_30_54_11 TaxID=1817892 RepID=A0A1J5IZS7_9BACT|nr:MAG: hypothetical protein AUK40_04540 [Candidatus Wirthbacteria bacterium CG2_30_54_11]
MKKNKTFSIIYHSPSFSMSVMQQPVMPLMNKNRIRHISFSQEFNPARYLTLTGRKKDPTPFMQ